MSMQASLPGFAPAPATDRLFIAVFPDPASAIQLQQFAAAHFLHHGLGDKTVDADRLHVTLFHLGDWAGLPPDLVNNANAALANIEASSFEVSFNQIGSFDTRPKEGPWVFTATEGNEALHALHNQLAMHLRGAALAR